MGEDRTSASPAAVGPAGRFLVDAAGRRVFLLADTAWELFHRWTREQTARYLAARSRQGFNAVMAVLLAELDGLATPTPEGLRPLIGNDPARPAAAYFDEAEARVAEMNRLGLTAVLLPAWGDKVTLGWGVGPVVFDAGNAAAYGDFLARRFAGRGVIWMLGGDRHADAPADRRVWEAMAAAIRGAGDRRLITWHPPGGRSSSAWFPDAAWLDFHSLQTGHTGRQAPIEAAVAADRALRPAKPVWNAEPCYEAHPVMRMHRGGWKPAGGFFDEHDVRDAAWRSAFSGACGHAYGCHSVWQAYEPEGPRATEPVNFPGDAWHRQLALPGAEQMRHLAAFMAEHEDWEPLDPGHAGDLPALRSASGKEVAVYAMKALPIAYRRRQLEGLAARVGVSPRRWLDPRTGRETPAEPGRSADGPDPSRDAVLRLA
ncbi:apiosidase-like domain-containing protein [Phycisphaera mikurensis]|uniref:Apiosidase-like catalytic domain-containing protein n=1 Tax=Phycisphaera mikurensis (strain NBRC 102666 / KCTC 22515 / FYK2301M01) TaxID=1142394 RepID=I0IEQ8_PHYMF|nr:DUF4038 domain-containing protein [Phycisphaera mikurensis]MBB6441542.1 hypothetical protein [Phycisphaera mikurensis]BAM03746.1 hypothetical protein PSMK_15870 [Phycisphaera mikurensis NBRC 102666]